MIAGPLRPLGHKAEALAAPTTVGSKPRLAMTESHNLLPEGLVRV
jgi:hypothetical protein